MLAVAMTITRNNSARGQVGGIAILSPRVISFFLAVLATVLFCSCTTPMASEMVCRATVPDTAHIDIHGNVYLADYPSDLLHAAFDAGDTALVTLLGKTHRLTVVSDVREAPPGSAVLHFHPGNPPYDRMAVVNGAFAVKAGIATQVAAEDGGKPRWEPGGGIGFPVKVKIARAANPVRRSGFSNYARRSNERADYPNLTDAEFANFRPVSAPSIASGTLYRSSSPIDPSLGRKQYANAALAACGVKTVWNMADTADEAWIHSGKQYDGHYHAGCTICYKPLGTDFNSPLFKAGMRDGLRFLSKEEPPFLIHCKEGRDRTGFAAMLIEALCGATRAEIEADYMKSFENYAIGDFNREGAAESFAYCMKALGLEGVPDAELAARAMKYLRDIGMEDHEIKALLTKLVLPPR